MDWMIVLIVVVALVALVALALIQTRSATLRRRFGPEYERLVAQEGDRRRAEACLRERTKRRQALNIRELAPDAAAAYAEQWSAAQLQFVDDPSMSLAEAGGLVDQVARERGYPFDRQDEGIEMVSVDYPRLVGHYRVARAIQDRSVDEKVDIDDVRTAFRSYRLLFEELIGERAPRSPMASAGPTKGEAP